MRAVVIDVGEGQQPHLAALVVEGDGAGLAAAVDRSTRGATASLTIAEAIDALPGVSQQQRVFNQIIAVTVVIAIIVVGLLWFLGRASVQMLVTVVVGVVIVFSAPWIVDTITG